MGEQRHPASLVLLGWIAGIVAFVGCFVPFWVGGEPGSVVIPAGGGSWSWWWYFIPILIGLGTLALLVPRLTVAAILPLGAVGLAIGLKASIDSIDVGNLTNAIAKALGASGGGNIGGRLNTIFHSGFGPGPGFFMIVIAGAVLALVWARIVHVMAVARFGSITEIIAIRTSEPASPGAPSAAPGSPSSAAAARDTIAGSAPDPGSSSST